MKSVALIVLIAAFVLPFAGSFADTKAPPAQQQQTQQQQVAPPNPNIDMDAYVKSVKEVAKHRETPGSPKTTSSE